jgi:hypothetical protein
MASRALTAFSLVLVDGSVHLPFGKTLKNAIAGPLGQLTYFRSLNKPFNLRFWPYSFHLAQEVIPQSAETFLCSEIHIL